MAGISTISVLRNVVLRDAYQQIHFLSQWVNFLAPSTSYSLISTMLRGEVLGHIS